MSLNTVFGKLTSLVKPANVVKTARAMGIPAVESASGANPGAPTLMRNGNPDDYVGIGNYPVRIMDQAVGYATLANGGLARPAYFVEKITDSKGNLVYQHKDKAKRVLDKRVANDTTLSMQEVAQSLADPAGRRAAGGRQDRHGGHPGHRRLQRRLDGRVHPAGQRGVLGGLGQGRADL